MDQLFKNRMAGGGPAFNAYQNWTGKANLADKYAADIKAIKPFFRERRAGRPAPNGKTALFGSFLPVPYPLKIEGLLSKMLQDRGWRCLSLHNPFSEAGRPYHQEVFGNESLLMTDFQPWEEYDSIAQLADRALAGGWEKLTGFQYQGDPVGLNAVATLTSFIKSGRMNPEDAFQQGLLKKMLVQTIMFNRACARIIDDYRPELVIAKERGFVGSCEIFNQSLKARLDYVQWLHCHEPNTTMLKRFTESNRRSHPFSISARTWQRMKAAPWREGYRRAVMEAFEQGYGSDKWFAFKLINHRLTMSRPEEIRARLGLDPAKRTAVIFCHILNDANLFYGRDLFPGGFAQWLVETVRAAAENPRLNWVLKLHPSNLLRRANMNYQGEYSELKLLKDTFGRLPEQLKIITPEDEINPLSLFKALDYGLTVRGTVGAEIPCLGKPVLTAGSGRYSGLGFTDDSADAAQYLARIKNLDALGPLDEDRTRLALKHAYLFFVARPAPYGSIVRKSPLAAGEHAYFKKNLEFQLEHVSQIRGNPQMEAIIDWITASKEEDFLRPDLIDW